MEQTEPPRSRLKGDTGLDRISNLPSDLIDKILSCLTLKEAVRTCVLSSKWRNIWAMLSDLVFDQRHFSAQNIAAIVNIVDHVLLNHIGPIHKFKVYGGYGTESVQILIDGVLHLSRDSIQYFAVHYLGVGGVPGMLLKSCLDLHDLSLSVNFNDLAEILTTLYILRISPALEKLLVRYVEERIPIDEEANSWLDNLDDDRNCSFCNLRLVKIAWFTGCKAELDFIKFLHLSSPVLERMTISAVKGVSADGSSEVIN